MKRIWLYLYAQDKKEVDIQREGLTKHCRENHMNIVGETVMIRETKLDPDGFSAAINCAVENRCDYLATHKTETIEMDDQMGIAICEAYQGNAQRREARRQNRWRDIRSKRTS